MESLVPLILTSDMGSDMNSGRFGATHTKRKSVELLNDFHILDSNVTNEGVHRAYR